MMNVLRSIPSGMSSHPRLLLLLFLLAASLATVGTPKAHASGCGCGSFVHTSTAANTHANYTILYEGTQLTFQSKLFVTAAQPNAASDLHPLGVYYSGTTWKIFNQDAAPMPIGAAFNVMYFAEDPLYVQTITGTSSNTFGNSPMLYNTSLHLITEPHASVFVTAYYGSNHVLDPHPVGVWYTGTHWSIFNEDLAPMPVGASFNVEAFFNPYRVTATPGVNSDANGSYVFLNDPLLNNHPNLVLVVTPNWEPNHVYDPHPLEVGYFLGYYIIFHADGAPMLPGASFNIAF